MSKAVGPWPSALSEAEVATRRSEGRLDEKQTTSRGRSRSVTYDGRNTLVVEPYWNSTGSDKHRHPVSFDQRPRVIDLEATTADQFNCKWSERRSLRQCFEQLLEMIRRHTRIIPEPWQFARQGVPYRRILTADYADDADGEKHFLSAPIRATRGSFSSFSRTIPRSLDPSHCIWRANRL
jgi:hypothetical protein